MVGSWVQLRTHAHGHELTVTRGSFRAPKTPKPQRLLRKRVPLHVLDGVHWYDAGGAPSSPCEAFPLTTVRYLGIEVDDALEISEHRDLAVERSATPASRGGWPRVNGSCPARGRFMLGHFQSSRNWQLQGG